jgi:hypothetical protein
MGSEKRCKNDQLLQKSDIFQNYFDASWCHDTEDDSIQHKDTQHKHKNLR